MILPQKMISVFMAVSRVPYNAFSHQSQFFLYRVRIAHGFIRIKVIHQQHIRSDGTVPAAARRIARTYRTERASAFGDELLGTPVPGFTCTP